MLQCVKQMSAAMQCIRITLRTVVQRKQVLGCTMSCAVHVQGMAQIMVDVSSVVKADTGQVPAQMPEPMSNTDIQYPV